MYTYIYIYTYTYIYIHIYIHTYKSFNQYASFLSQVCSTCTVEMAASHIYSYLKGSLCPCGMT